MTIEELKSFRGLMAEYKQLNDQIRNLYRNIRSPFNPSGSHSMTPGDPTNAAAMKIIDLKEQAKDLQIRITGELEVIEAWLITVEDAEVRAIVRAHYINGKTWKQTASEVYGYADPATPRKRIRRYFC